MKPEQNEEELENIIRKYSLFNAFTHSGKASEKAVLGKILGEYPDLRPKAKELMPIIAGIVKKINQMNQSEIETELSNLAPELLSKEKHHKQLVLPELPNLKTGDKVVMRFAPGPSGPLHIGHTRAVILNDEYVKRYSGKFIIRLEDTNPNNIDPKAYEMIKQDLLWLGVEFHEFLKQSDRFDIYYKYAEELLKSGQSYICTCPVESWRRLKENKQPCPDRKLPVDEQLARWEKLLNREYSPGQVSFIVKTDLTHPNPAIRDFVGMRIVPEPHPITGDKYYVYPTYNFSVAVDDHLMGITHILRGKDHLNNTHRQKFVYRYFNWPLPEFIHYGWVSMSEVELKTTTIKEGIKSGQYTDWSDIQLGTLQALARRGIQPEAIRRFWLDVGIKEVDIEFSWQNLYSFNKAIIDKTSDRYFFVWQPTSLVISGVSELIGHAPLHPDEPSRGTRVVKLNSGQSTVETGQDVGIKILINREDILGLEPGTKLRLKDLCNIELTNVEPDNSNTARYIGDELEILKAGVKIIHWIPDQGKIPLTVNHPDGSTRTGFCEPATINALNKIVQFERFGFVKLGSRAEPTIEGWFAHK